MTTANEQPNTQGNKRDQQGSSGGAENAPNQGVSTPEPAEGADDKPGGTDGSPKS